MVSLRMCSEMHVNVNGASLAYAKHSVFSMIALQSRFMRDPLASAHGAAN